MAFCSSRVASNQVATSRRGTISVCPGDTGKPSRMAKASAFDATWTQREDRFALHRVSKP